jgi:hypothetical protein
VYKTIVENLPAYDKVIEIERPGDPNHGNIYIHI